VNPNLLIPEFDEENHCFHVLGKPAPGVTSILRSCGIGVNSFWTVEGREFGRAVHKAAHYHSEGDLDFDSLDDKVKPRIEAYIKFCADMQFKPDLIEQPLYRTNPVYCGIPDQVQLDRAVIDLKNGPHEPEHALQLAGYTFFLPNPHRYERWAVHLMDTGKYSLRVFPKQELQADYNVFCSALNIHNWRSRYGC
jgi:hypothetical protein